MADDHTGGMIALVPDNPGSYTVPDGDPASEMHCTLVFLGDDVASLPESVTTALAEACASIAANQYPVSARIMGPAIWNRDGGPNGTLEPATVTLLAPGDNDGDDDDQVPNLQDRVASMARQVMGAALYPQQYDPWQGHVTAGFSLPPDQLPNAKGMASFGTLRLALGPNNQDFRLAGSPDGLIAEDAPMYAREGVTEMADTKAAPEVGAPGEDGTVPVFFPCLAVEGMETSDGRYIEPGALGVRTPPLSVFAQTTNTGKGGHAGSTVVGNLTEAWRIPGPEFVSRQTGEPLPEGTFVWQGRGEVDGNSEGGKLFVKRYLRGNSVDLSEADYADDIQYEEDGGEKHRVTVTKGMIGATTLCAIPAFPDAYGEIEGEDGAHAWSVEDLDLGERPKTAEGLADFLRDRGIQPVTASVAMAEYGDACSECLAEEFKTAKGNITADERKKSAAKGTALPDGSFPINDEDELDSAVKLARTDEQRAHVIKRAKALGKPDRIPDNWGKGGSRTASGDALPPLEYFTDPGFEAPTPLTIEGDRIFGHIATWGTCHIGISKRCTPPPKSYSDYQYFNTGAKRVVDPEGETRTVAVGHLTMNTGHAELSASADETVRHYDHTGTQAAVVSAGEDSHGIWINGLLSPELSAADRERLAAAPPSGDWRNMGGHLELVGVLAVNVPGYPVPRARVASGMAEPAALVAAGATRPASAFSGGIDLDALADRIVSRLEARLTLGLAEEVEPDEQAQLLAELDQLEAVEGLRPFSAHPEETPTT